MNRIFYLVYDTETLEIAGSFPFMSRGLDRLVNGNTSLKYINVTHPANYDTLVKIDSVNGTSYSVDQQNSKRKSALLDSCTQVDCFELDGLIFFAKKTVAVDQFIKDNPSPADFFVWLQQTYRHIPAK